MDKLTFGELIKGRRLSFSLTRKELAQSIGMSLSYLNNIERGIQVPSTELLLKIADRLTLDKTALFDALSGESNQGELKRVITLPDNFTDQDLFLITTLLDYISSVRSGAKINKPKWIGEQYLLDRIDEEDNLEARLNTDPEEVRASARKRQKQITGLVNGGKKIEKSDTEEGKAS